MTTQAPREFNCHEQEQPSWFDRAQRASRLIAAFCARDGEMLTVSDIGCGDMKLRPFLASAVPNVSYTGFDLVPQSPDVQPLDIRSQALGRPTDVAIMLGVSEYLENLPAVLQRLASEASWLLVSHVLREHSKYTPERLRELGWVNHLSADEFGGMLASSGFDVRAEELTANHRTMMWLCRSRARPSLG